MITRQHLMASCTTLFPMFAALFLAGCASSPTSQADPANAPKVIDLQRGMTPAQVVAMIGEPTETRIAEPTSSNIVIWVYSRKIGSRVDAVAPTMVSEPWVDPITNQLFYLESPEASERRVDFIEELTLYFASGQLTEANRTVKREYQFSR